jgi:HSP20 family protein
MNLIVRRNGVPVSAYVNPAQPFGRFFDSVFDDMIRGPAGNSGRDLVSQTRIEVTETDKAYEIRAEIPGVKRQDLKLLVNAGQHGGTQVSLDAEVRRQVEQKDGETALQSERVTRKFSRVFSLAAEVDEAQAVARLEDGVLSLTLPKREVRQARHITIQ